MKCVNYALFPSCVNALHLRAFRIIIIVTIITFPILKILNNIQIQALFWAQLQLILPSHRATCFDYKF